MATGFSELLALTKASSDGLRLNILRALNHNAYSVRELCDIFKVGQPALSHHLKILSEGGLVRARREGVYLFYHRTFEHNNTKTRSLQQALWHALDSYPLPPKIISGIRAITKRRKQSCVQFFKQNIDKFRTQQDLIANYKSYASVAQSILEKRFAHGANTGRSALEVGPGDGSFLPVLAQYFDSITALDISAEMLHQARKTARDNSLDNVLFIQGDTESTELASLKVDCVVLNMVLHHTPSPEQMLKDLFSVLKPGGALVLSELCAHNQDWARTHCGDLWLGFAPEALERIAEDIGFCVGHSQYIGQSNGFQIQVREFTHDEHATHVMERAL